MQANSGSVRTCLCLLLLLTSGLAGCADKGDDGAEEARSGGLGSLWPWSDPEPGASDTDGDTGSDGPMIAEPGTEGGACNGCVGLLPPDELEALPPDATGPRTTVRVPQPHDGDQVFVWNRTSDHGSAEGSFAAGITPAATQTPDGTLTMYAKTLNVDPAVADVVEPYVEIRLADLYDGGTLGSASTYHHLMDPKSGMIVEQRLAVRPDDPPAPRGTTHGEERVVSHTRSHLHPTHRTAFEFGAHLWGRVLEEGDTFVIRVEPRDALNLVHEAHEYRYRVVDVAERTGDALVALEIVGHGFARETWRLLMSHRTPYPIVTERLRWLDPLPGQGLVAEEYAFVVQSRGRYPLPLATPIGEAAAHRIGHGGHVDYTGYITRHYDGSQHPAQFDDDSVVYPLRYALVDLRLFGATADPPIRVEAFSEGVIVAADLRPQWTSEHASPGEVAVWHITALHERWGLVSAIVERPVAVGSGGDRTLGWSGFASVRGTQPHDAEPLVQDPSFGPVMLVEDRGRAEGVTEDLGGSLESVNVVTWRLLAPRHRHDGPGAVIGLGHEAFPYQDKARLSEPDNASTYVLLDARSGLVERATVFFYKSEPLI